MNVLSGPNENMESMRVSRHDSYYFFPSASDVGCKAEPASNWYANEDWGSGSARTEVVQWPNSGLLVTDWLSLSIYLALSTSYNRDARVCVQQWTVPQPTLYIFFFITLSERSLLFFGTIGWIQRGSWVNWALSTRSIIHSYPHFTQSPMTASLE